MSVVFQKFLALQYTGSNGSEVFDFLVDNLTNPSNIGWTLISESSGVLTLRYDYNVDEWVYVVVLADQYLVGLPNDPALPGPIVVDEADFLDRFEEKEALGIEGPTGPAGATGPTGPTGPAGPTPSMAAGVGNVPALLAGAEQDITIGISPALPTTPTQVTAVLTAGGGLLGGVSILSITPLSTTSVKIRVKNTSGLLSSSGVAIIDATA